MRLINVYLLALFISGICSSVVVNPAKLTSAKSGITAIQANNIVYLAGGYKFNDKVATTEIDLFDLSTKQLINANLTLNHSRGDITALNIPPNIYFVGGNEYINRPLIYRQDRHNFEEIGNTPTVRNIRRASLPNLSISNSILTVVGDFSVDFYDLSNNRWHFNEQLTSIVSRLDNECVYPADGYAFVIGGVDAYTQISSTKIYIYDIHNDSIVEKDILQENDGASSCEVDFMNGVMLYRRQNPTYFVAYKISTKEWIKEINFPNVLVSATVGDQTFVFNDTSIYTIDWQTGARNVTDLAANIEQVLQVGDYIVYWSLILGSGASIQYVTMTGPTYEQIVTTATIPFSIITDSKAKLVLPPNRFALWSDSDLVIINVELHSVSPVSFPGSTIISVSIHPNVSDSLLVSLDAPISPRLLVVPFATPKSYSTHLVNMTFEFLIGKDLVSLSQGLVGVDLDATNPMKIDQYSNREYKAAQDGDSFALFQYDAQVEAYKYIDVYNYEDQIWSDPIQISPDLDYSFDSNHIPGVLDGKVVLFGTNTTGYYDLDTKKWSVIQHDDVNLAPRRGIYSIEVPFLEINNEVYLRPYNSLYFNKFDFQHQWGTTHIASNIGYGMDQYFLHENVIFVSTLNAYNNQSYAMFFYDIGTDIWDSINFEGINTTVSIAKIGDYLAFFDANGNTKSLYLPGKVWEDMPVSNYSSGIRFSVTVEAHFNNETISLIAGGIDAATNRATDAIYIMTDDGVHPLVVSPLTAPSFTPGVQELSGGIIAAIVVPIGVVAIGSAVLAIFLVRRNKKRRQNNGTISMTGLEAKYGEWYTPFSDITFGQQLGQGASGQVFEGTWKSTKAALKVSATQANQTVINELELMITLRPHPNVVQLLGFSVHPETHNVILIIEFCNQGSLAATLYDEKKDVSMEQKMSWLVGIAKGLSHLHSNNIVHRDVAARNVLLHQGEAKITDFGMSRLVDDQKQHGTTKSELGPIRWMAPESIKNKTYSAKTDVWSFGILMYEVVSRQEPHSSADPIEIGRLIRDQGLTPSVPSSCPVELSTLMKECWHMNADQRPNIDDIIGILEDIDK